MSLQVAKKEADRKTGGAASCQGKGQTAPTRSQALQTVAEWTVQHVRSPVFSFHRLLQLKVSIKCFTLKPLSSEFWISFMAHELWLYSKLWKWYVLLVMLIVIYLFLKKKKLEQNKYFLEVLKCVISSLSPCNKLNCEWTLNSLFP